MQIPTTQDTPAKTVVHETLHLADRQGTVKHGLDGSLTTLTTQYSSHQFTTGDGYIRTHLQEDWANIERAAASAGKSTEQYLREGMDERGLANDYEGRAFFSDFVDAASNGTVQLGWAHTFKDANYWTKRGGENVGTECLANYGGSALCNEIEYEAIRHYFPRATRTLDDLLEAMANADTS